MRSNGRPIARHSSKEYSDLRLAEVVVIDSFRG